MASIADTYASALTQLPQEDEIAALRADLSAHAGEKGVNPTDETELVAGITEGVACYRDGKYSKSVLAFAVISVDSAGRKRILLENNCYENGRHSRVDVAKVATESLRVSEYSVEAGEIVLHDLPAGISRAVTEELGLRVRAPFASVMTTVGGGTDYVEAARAAFGIQDSPPLLSPPRVILPTATVKLPVKPKAGIPRDYSARLVFAVCDAETLAPELHEDTPLVTVEHESETSNTVTEFIWRSFATIDELHALLARMPYPAVTPAEYSALADPPGTK